MLLILTTACNAAPNADLNLEDHYEEFKIADIFTGTRGKRSLSLIAQGAKAVTKLLENTKRTTGNTRYGRQYRNYKKLGDFDTALKDFESVDPVSVTTKVNENGVKIVKGFVGNKRIKIRSPGYKKNSNAVLDVYDIVDFNTGMSGPPYISILYKNKF